MATQGGMTGPEVAAESIAPELVRELVQRAARPDFARFEAQLRSSGYCARPVRLRGRIETCDGHGHRRVWTTDTEPDGILRKACGNRREAVCPPCAERYRGDAYQLIAAGLRGGKGVPDSVVEHPALARPRWREVKPLAPASVEAMRAAANARDATLISVLAYAGLRPQEALALQWGDVRERTLLIQRAVSLGEEKDTKTRAHRTVRLLAPLREDLLAWRLRSGRPGETALVFPGPEAGCGQDDVRQLA